MKIEFNRTLRVILASYNLKVPDVVRALNLPRKESKSWACRLYSWTSTSENIPGRWTEDLPLLVFALSRLTGETPQYLHRKLLGCDYPCTEPRTIREQYSLGEK